jgi:hypothetical protein
MFMISHSDINRLIMEDIMALDGFSRPWDWKALEIACGEGQDAYKVVIEAESAFLDKVKKNPQIMSKKGEELVAAILAAAEPLDLNDVTRYNKDGKQNDGPHGEPAIQSFDITGKHGGGLVNEIHAKDGMAGDTADGVPALLMFSKGKLTGVRFKKGDVFKDMTGEEYTRYKASLKKSPPANKPKPRSPGR